MKTRNRNKSARTPSGTVITHRATDIRGFFENGSINELVNVVDYKTLKLSGSHSTQCQPILREETNENSVSANSSNRDGCLLKTVKQLIVEHDKKINKQKKKGAKHKVIAVHGLKTDKRTVKKKKLIKEDKFFTPPSTPIHRTYSNCELDKMNGVIAEKKQIGEERNKQTVRTGVNIATQLNEVRTEMKEMLDQSRNVIDAEEIDVISMRSVMAMFKKLEGKLESIEQEAIKNPASRESEGLLKRVQDIEKEISKSACTVELEKQLKHQQALNKIQCGTIQRQSDLIEEITQRLDNMEMNVNKKMITLTSLPIRDMKDKDREIAQIVTFFDENLGIEPDIEDYFFIGSGDPPTLVITLANLCEKRYIMNNKAELKGVKTNGKSHYINDYLPVAVSEKRRKDRELTAMYPEGAISFKRGKLQVQGKYYVPGS